MKKCLLLVVMFLNVVACSSDNNSSNPATQNGDQHQETVVPADNAPLKVDAPNVYEFTSGPQGQLSIHIYSEDDIWIIEQNVIEADGLPTPKGRWTFTTKEKAYAYATENLGVTEAQRNDTAFNVTVEDDILFSQDLKSANVLWDVKNTWTWEWEIAFAKWMRDNLHPDFFEKLGIENDCADAYYQTRMIFAYENALPVTFRLASSGSVFTQNVVRPEWKKLKTDDDWRKNKQFLKALDYIANTTYTHTLGADTYPMEISEEGLIEGTAFLYLDQHSGHTLLVNEINLGKNSTSKTRLPMYTLNSTVPKTVRPLYEAMFYESSQPKKTKYGNTGFVRFRWPKSSGSKNLVDAKDMPYYSEEQYEPGFMTPVTEEGEYQNFSLTVFKRLNPDFDPTLRITEGLLEVSDMIEARKEVILEGYEVCKKGCLEGSADYENWSTPSRDKRIKELMQDLEKYQSALYSFKDVVDAWTKALESNIVELDGSSYLLSHVKWTFDNAYHSSDPNQTPAVRWGLAPEAFAQAAYAQLNPLLKVRKEKVSEKNNCATSPSCLVYSNEYIEKSTFIEDQDIQNSIQKRNMYCEMAGALACANFKTALSTLATVAPGHANFLETWEKIYILNSDPRVTEAQRWGAMPANLNTLTIDGSYSSVGLFGSKVILTKDIYPKVEIAVLDVTTKTITTLRQYVKGGTALLNAKTGMLVLTNYDKLDIEVIDMTTMNSQVLPMEKATSNSEYGIYAYTNWIDDSHFIVSYQEKVAAFTLVDTQFVQTGLFENYQYISGSKFLYKTVNLEKVENAPSNYEVTVVDMFDNTKAPIVFLANDILGKTHPSYISFADIATEKAVLISWSKYTNTDTLSGQMILNAETGDVKQTKALAGYLSSMGANVATTSTYNEQGDESTTVFYFFNDDLSIKSEISVKGSCMNCYERSETLQIGSDVYKLDIKNQQVIKTMSVEGVSKNASANINGIYENYAVVSYYDETLSYYTLFDIQSGKALMTGESLSFSNNTLGLYPTISTTKYHTVGTGDQQKYYGLNLVLDLENLGGGPIITPMYSDFEGGEGEFEHEPEIGEDGEILEADVQINRVPSPQDVSYSIKVIDPSVIQDKSDPISILNIGDQKTVIIFR